jgi:hypothetical protein
MKIVFSCLAFVLAVTATNVPAFAQRETANGVDIESDVALIRRDLRAEKKRLITLNVPLTEAEAAKFWPVYDQYVAEMARHNDTFYALIKDYAATQKTITDAQAMILIKRWSDIQVQIAQTRQKYVPQFEKVIPGKKVALFMQIDRRLYTLMDLQVTSQLPLLIQ